MVPVPLADTTAAVGLNWKGWGFCDKAEKKTPVHEAHKATVHAGIIDRRSKNYLVIISSKHRELIDFIIKDALLFLGTLIAADTASHRLVCCRYGRSLFRPFPHSAQGGSQTTPYMYNPSGKGCRLPIIPSYFIGKAPPKLERFFIIWIQPWNHNFYSDLICLWFNNWNLSYFQNIFCISLMCVITAFIVACVLIISSLLVYT